MYRLLLPIARLPIWLHYRFSDMLWPVVYYVARYRLKVVRDNLERSFPYVASDSRFADRSAHHKWLRHVERQFYRHLTDLLAEGLYNTAASFRSIAKRYRFEHAELLEQYYDEGRSVVLLSSHYNNWEYMITTLDPRIKHHAVGVGKPLDNKSFGTFITNRRARFGTEIVDQTNVRDVMNYYDHWHVPVAYMMLSDQSPSNPHRSLWTQFLHQDTAFLYGAEHFARKYNMPVVGYDVRKERRGHYVVSFYLMTDSPNSLPEGDLTRRYAAHTEQLIGEQPQYWLWSHRRWKLTREGRIMKDGTLKIINDKSKTIEQK